MSNPDKLLDGDGVAKLWSLIKDLVSPLKRNYVIYADETLSSEYKNSTFKNLTDESFYIVASSGGVDYKLKDVNGNDVYIKDLKIGDTISLRQLNQAYPERFVGAITSGIVHFYSWISMVKCVNSVIQNSRFPISSGAVYNALLPLTEVKTTTTIVANTVEVPTSAKGLATLKQIGGMSYKVNQLIDFSNADTTRTTNGITITKGTNGKFTVSGQTLNSSLFDIVPNCYSLINGHKYYFYAKCTNRIYFTSGTDKLYDDGNGALFTADADIIGTADIMLDSTATTTYNFELTPQIFDLTAMGIDTTDVDVAKAELLKRGIDVNTYNEYNAGSIHDSAVTKVESVGANRFDLNNATFNAGVTKTANGIQFYNSSYSSSATDLGVVKEIFPNIQAGQTYVLSFSYTNLYENIFYLGGSNTSVAYQTPHTFTQAEIDGHIYAYAIGGNTGEWYNIMLNKGSTVLPYAQYKKYTLDIPQAIRSITGYGWGVNDNCYNYLNLTLNEFRQYVGKYTFTGNESWYPNGNYQYTTGNSLNLQRKLSASYWQNAGNLLCPNLTTTSQEQIYYGSVTNAIGFTDNTSIGGLCISKDVYENISSLTGKTIYFELATPVITDVSSLLDEVHIPIEAGGTVELVNPYNNAVPVQVTFDNGLVDVVLTNHNHDIEQQKQIDFLLRGGNLKTINGQSLVGSGNISINADISHRYNIGLYDSNYMPIFIAFLVDAEQESYDTAPSKDTAISWIKGVWGKEQGNEIWFATDVTNDAGYYKAGTGIVQAYEGLIGVVYDESQGSGSETITTYYADGTTQQIALSDIGDSDQDNYFFRVF